MSSSVTSARVSMIPASAAAAAALKSPARPERTSADTAVSTSSFGALSWTLICVPAPTLNVPPLISAPGPTLS